MTKDIPVITGTTLLRDAVKARKQSSAIIAREHLEVPAEHLAAFIAGTRTLPPDTLKKLATYLFNGSVEYVPALDRLRAVSNAKGTTMQAYPPRWQATDYQKPTIPTRGPKPEKPVKPVPQTRPGWA